MRRAIAVIMAAFMMTVSISCASSGQAAGGTSEAQETSAAQEEVRDQASSAAAAQEEVRDQASSAVTVQEAAAAAETAAQEQAVSTAQEAAAEAASGAGEQAAAAAQAASREQEISAQKIEALFGEGGPLYGLLPEGTDAEAIVGAVREQMGIVNRQFGRAIEEIVEKSESESVDFDQESLQKFAEVLLGQFIGDQADDDDFEFESFDALIQACNDVRETEKEYIAEHNSGLMESGDVQIVASDIYHEDEYEQEEFRVLCNMIQNNYRMDEENQLWLVDSAEDVVLFTHENNQEDKYPVKDAVFAEKGDNYLSSVEALFNETGESTDNPEEELETSRVFVLYDLKNYLEEHPEVKGIEYEGQIRTAEELDEIWTVKLDELCDKYPEDSSSQAAASDSGTDAASSEE